MPGMPTRTLPQEGLPARLAPVPSPWKSNRTSHWPGLLRATPGLAAGWLLLWCMPPAGRAGWAPGGGRAALLVACLYALAVWACAWRLARAGRQVQGTQLWAGLALLLLVLGLNLPLDWLDVLTRSGRQLSKDQGWYGQRRVWQALVIVALLLVWLAAAWGARRRHRHGPTAAHHRPVGQRLAAWAGAGLLCFVLVRTVSLHQVDAWLNVMLGPALLGQWLEGLALLMVGVGVLADPVQPPGHGAE